MKTISNHIQDLRLSGLSSPSRDRRFLFIFSHSDYVGWWSKYIDGYTHISLFAFINDDYGIFLDPALDQCHLAFGEIPSKKSLGKNTEVFELEIHTKKENRLIKPVMQTCTTFIQYVTGISLDTFIVQELYNKLDDYKANSNYLEKLGIMRVKKWE